MSQSKTPGVVIVAAVIMFIYGALLLLCVACGGIGLVANPPDQMGLQAALDKDAPGHKIVQVVAMGFNFLFAAGLIGAGFGVLWLSQIARYATYAGCLAILLVTCVNTGYQVIVVSPVTERIVEKQMAMPQGQGAPPNVMKTAMIGGRVLGAVIGIGIPLLFCIPIIILLTVKSARDGFAGRTPEDPAEEQRRSRLEGYDDDDRDYRRPSGSSGSSGDTGIQE